LFIFITAIYFVAIKKSQSRRILAFWQIHDKLIHFPPLIADTIILIPSVFIVQWAHYCNTEIVMQ